MCLCETRKIVELEEELRVVGNNLKSLEVSEEKVFPSESLSLSVCLFMAAAIPYLVFSL